MTSKEKVYPTIDAAVADIPDGATIMFGGFGGAGFPNNLIQALARQGARNLSVISNNCGTGEGELGLLFKNRQIRRVVAAFPGPGAKYFQEQFDAGEIELELVPQGILCERMRAFGAGIPAFFSPVGVGTEIASGKEERVIRGKRYILEQALGADYAFIRAYRADHMGNLIYHKAARNFNPKARSRSHHYAFHICRSYRSGRGEAICLKHGSHENRLPNELPWSCRMART
jgi:3-oxoacid CoA-transferase subunit A